MSPQIQTQTQTHVLVRFYKTICDCDWLDNWTQSIIYPSKWQYNLNICNTRIYSIEYARHKSSDSQQMVQSDGWTAQRGDVRARREKRPVIRFFNQFIDMQIKNTIDKKANFQCVQRQMLTMCLCAGIRLLCCDQGMRIEKSYAYAPKHRINRTTECWRKLFYNSVHKYHRIETVSAIFHILFTKRRLDWLAIVLMYNCTCVSQIHARAHCKPHRTNRYTTTK